MIFLTIKADDPEPGVFRLKNRAVTHGNKDSEKFDIPSDAEVAGLFCVRVLLLFCTLQHWNLVHVDIKKAFMQSHTFSREVYVVPPKSWLLTVVWKLLKKPVYGLVDACRAWHRTLNEFLLSYGFRRIHPDLPQLFLIRSPTDQIQLIVAVVVDDILIGGMRCNIEHFASALSSRFEIGKISSFGSDISFDGGQISQVWNPDGSLVSTTFSMHRRLQSVLPLSISRERRKQFDDAASVIEVRDFRRLAGQLSFIGMATVPAACYVASFLQQQVGSLRVQDCVVANTLLKSLQSLPGILRYVPCDTVDLPSDLRLFAFVDASHKSTVAYGQTGILHMICPSPDCRAPMLPLHWISRKQRRVSSSSYGAEVLAAELACSSSVQLADALGILFAHRFPRTILTDSRGLWTALDSLVKAQSFRLVASTSVIRDYLESGRIDNLFWIRGITNLADALTKHSRFPALQAVVSRNVLEPALLQDLAVASTL
jgi:Reverse transcriptase (RNA-dependent DNA polymerase)